MFHSVRFKHPLSVLRTHAKQITLFALIGLLLILFVPQVDADSTSIDFESYSLGSVNGQDGWSMTGSYDVAVVDNTYGYATFGTQSLRISNGITSGGFGDQTFSPSLTNEAGETSAVNEGLSGGVRQPYFEASWDFASTVPVAEQPGLQITASPDRGDGARMSWIQMADNPSGLAVSFYDFAHVSPVDCNLPGASWRQTEIATGLDRTVPHNIKVTMQFVDGINNDVIQIYVDGVLVHTGLSWEDYFRDCETEPTRTVDSILFRASGTAVPANSGNGFLIDNMTLTSSPLSETTTVVSPSNMNGWSTYEEISSGSAAFITGPGTPPLGIGSAELTVDATGRLLLGTSTYTGTPLNELTQLTYSTYRTNASGDPQWAPTLQLDMDYDGIGGNDNWQGRLVFEPSLTGSNPLNDQWQTWNTQLTNQDGWWASGAPGNTVCTGGNPCTWAEVLAAFPNARIRPGGFVNFKVGGAWASGFTGSIDNFTIGINGNNEIYDFEPCSTGTIVNTDTTETFCSIQAAIDDPQTLDTHTIQVPAGNFNEKVVVNKQLTLLGANAGVAGNGSRGAESMIVYGAETTAVTITANNVTIDGFTLSGAQGVDINNQNGATIQNNIISTYAAGIVVDTTNTSTSNLTIQNNAISLAVQEIPTTPDPTPTAGIALANITGNQAAIIQNNHISGSLTGYGLYHVITSPPTTIQGGTITGVMQGIAAGNQDGFANFQPTNFAVDGVVMNGFTGTSSETARNFHAGIYIFTGRFPLFDVVTPPINATINNVNIQGTGSPQSDSAGLYFADFSTQSSQVVIVQNSMISNNANRGVFTRGSNATVSIDNSTISGNGYAPNGSGFGIVVRNGANLTVSNSPITNPNDTDVAAAIHSYQSNLTVKGNDIDGGTRPIFNIDGASTLLAYANNITNFNTAGLGAGTINARHNWWGAYASQPTGVDGDSWNYRLGAAMSSWGESTLGSASLTPDTGSGTGVIVSHGRDIDNVPFGKGNIPYANNMCSDYYDFFVLNASGDWTVRVPVDDNGDGTCDATMTQNALYQFLLSGTMPNTGCTGGACWIIPAGVGPNGRSLEATLDALTYLQGTPFVAGDNTPDSNDPTAVSLSTFSASTNTLGMVTAVLLLLLTLTTVAFWKRRTE